MLRHFMLFHSFKINAALWLVYQKYSLALTQLSHNAISVQESIDRNVWSLQWNVHFLQGKQHGRLNMLYWFCMYCIGFVYVLYWYCMYWYCMYYIGFVCIGIVCIVLVLYVLVLYVLYWFCMYCIGIVLVLYVLYWYCKMRLHWGTINNIEYMVENEE